eukprot:81596-Pelagomonas_calceolata.AAC.1
MWAFRRQAAQQQQQQQQQQQGDVGMQQAGKEMWACRRQVAQQQGDAGKGHPPIGTPQPEHG